MLPNSQDSWAGYYGLFLNAVMLVASLMAFIWLFRIKSKGTTAYLMSSAFIVLAALAYTIKIESDLNIRYALGTLLALLLGADVAVRASRQYREKGKRP